MLEGGLVFTSVSIRNSVDSVDSSRVVQRRGPMKGLKLVTDDINSLRFDGPGIEYQWGASSSTRPYRPWGSPSLLLKKGTGFF